MRYTVEYRVELSAQYVVDAESPEEAERIFMDEIRMSIPLQTMFVESEDVDVVEE